jgi:hypothetical protein
MRFHAKHIAVAEAPVGIGLGTGLDPDLGTELIQRVN